MAYPYVNITDSTPHGASGKVTYASIFCSDDDYTVAGNGGQWTATSRGVCLVTNISATVFTPSGPVTAAPYTSSGTAYSQFAIVQTGANSYAVTRLTLAADSTDVGELEDEPTAQQK